jgi:hypothetical protein
MADVYRPHACTEREALERLGSEADLGQDRLSRIRLEFDSSVHRRITLWVPDLVGQSHPPASAMGLDDGLARLLVNATTATTATMAPADSRRGAAPSHERLFITSHAPADAVVATLRRLERFATPARVARLRSEGGNETWLLHVLVDRERHSGFSGLEALGLFDAWQPLSGYASEGCRLFLTAGLSLPADLLWPLWRLLSKDEAASLLALGPQGPRDERFYVLSCTDREASRFERISLPPRAFVDSMEVGFALDACVRVSTMSRAVDQPNLMKDLREQAPSRGYRLTLESTRAVEDVGRDLDRLRSQHAYLAQRIAYAESLHRPRPRLLRFTARQLAALAHTIYSFAPDSLFNARPHVRYAFRATPQDPDGLHYLWIDPEAVRRTPDPLPLYDSSPPMRFWLDPTWGRHYHDGAGAAACVFVPEHTALVPPLHAWVPGDMDEHLRRVFAAKSSGSFVYVLDRVTEDAATLAPHPAWPEPRSDEKGAPRARPAGAERGSWGPASDGDGGAGGAKPPGFSLELTVFERDSFTSVDASVNWLNDNITVTGRLDVADLVRDAAAAARAAALSADAAAAASAARRDFLRDAARTRERFMKDLDAVVSSINRGTFDVLQRAHHAIDLMRGLDDDMKGLADIRERSKGIASVSDLLNGIEGLTTALTDRLSALEREVGAALRQAEAQSDDEQRRVDAFIESLEARRADLRARLRQGSGGVSP